MSKALDDLRKLRTRIVEIAEKHNLKVGPYTVAPAAEDGGRDYINVTFIMTPEALETAQETEKRKTDSAFEEMMSGVGLSEDFLTDDEKDDKDADKKAFEEARAEFLRKQKERGN